VTSEPTANAQRTRRNIIKIGAILAPAILARAKSARAVPVAACAVHCNCFLKGTKVRTIQGEREIEGLAVGDLLPTMFGGVRPIQWIGHYPLKKSDPSKPWVIDARPVQIACSALAPDVPHTDLYVTGGHALFIDGVLAPAGCLINGTTITRSEPRDYDELEFFHIKLESHDVIYAEGAPVETLVTVTEGAVNFAEYLRQYGSPKTDETPCAPRVTYGGGRDEMKSRIRSALSPWVDRREPIDVIRDRLEERGLMLSRQPALAAEAA
jgi:Hint domain